MKKTILILILGMFLISLISASSFCCEKTKTGAWCQNAEESKCDTSINSKTNVSFRKAPTSCEATSYCKLGCCYDSKEGTCMKNTGQIICNKNGGFWEDNANCDVPQCELGCCLIGDQAAFVSQQRCKRLSSIYNLEINFRTDIQNEIQCILSTTSEKKGACVFEQNFETDCKFTTKKECLDMSSQNVSFHEDFLCTAPELGTKCAKTQKTICVEGKDEVFFLDSCGNLANIYDATKINDEAYWRKIIEKADSCGTGKNNADSAVCGNCDYYLGSTCKVYKRGEDRVKPNYGDKICRDLSCTYLGKTYEHGETWCADAKGIKENLPGSRYFRLVCYDSEVLVEPCADYRQEICLQSDINGFSTSACRANRWQECTNQNKKRDCENADKRDCTWIGGSGVIQCVPKWAPGFNFWTTEKEGEAQDICSKASETCKVVYEKGLSGDKKCVENCECDGGGWLSNKEEQCRGLGDCGVKVNYIGVKGFNE